MNSKSQAEADENLLGYLSDIEDWNDEFGPFYRVKPHELPESVSSNLIWTEFSRTECYISDEFTTVEEDPEVSAYFIGSQPHDESAEYLKHMMLYERCFVCDANSQKSCTNCEGNGTVAIYLFDCLGARTALEVRDRGTKFWRKNEKVPNC